MQYGAAAGLPSSAATIISMTKNGGIGLRREIFSVMRTVLGGNPPSASALKGQV
jgi:hypothetical protein